MKKAALHFLFLFICTNSFSQLGPGYMGKHVQAGYGLHFSPAFLGSNGSEASIVGRGNSDGGDLAFNSIHEGFLELSFKNRTSVGFSAKYYKTTFDNSQAADITYYDGIYNYNTHTAPQGLYQINGLSYSLYFKFYYHRYVAPWGKYFLLGPSINTYKCFYNPDYMKIVVPTSTGNQNINNFGPQEQQFARGDILFGWGRSRVAFNRITIDYGLNFELLAMAQILFDATGTPLSDYFSSYSISNSDYIERTSRRRIREVNKFNIFFKVGVLLF